MPRIAGALRRIVLVGAIVGFFTPALAQSPAPPPAAAESVAVDAPVAKGAATAPAAGPLIRVAILPIRIHSARSLGPLTESLGQLIATRLEAREPNVVVVDSGPIRAAMGSTPGDLSDAELRKIADRAGVRAVVTGSLTELAGRFSLDLRVTPSSSDLRSQTIVITAESEEELQGHLDELIDRVAGVLSGATAGHIKTVFIVGAGDLEEELGALLDSKTGEVYSSQIARRDRERIEARSDIATVSISVQRTADGVELIFAVNPTGQLYGDRVKEAAGEKIEAIRIEGNRRIETDAIRARIKTKVGEAIDRAKLADDVKNVYGLGFFGHVTVTKSQGKEGVILTFQVEENPVVRQISIIGNEIGAAGSAIFIDGAGGGLDQIDIAGNRVDMMGFTPGFPYLGGLDERLATPRLETPRQEIVAGTVGIAESQTGVYPVSSPGGWRLIGRTPLRLFDPSRESPSLLSAGNFLRFVPIDGEDEFTAIQESVAARTYETTVSVKQ